MKKLTIKQLKVMKPGTIFAKGEIIDSPEGVNIAGSGEMLKWLATRGGIHDWAIYYDFAYKDFEWIKKWGNKVHAEGHIRKIVLCDDEAFKMYRH